MADKKRLSVPDIGAKKPDTKNRKQSLQPSTSGNDNVKKEKGKQLLDAILSYDQDLVQELLIDGVDFSVQQRGDCAIHLAARSGKLDIIKLLIKYGDKVTRHNENSNTAIHYATRDGHIDLIKYLKEKGGDVNAKNKEGETPLHFAVSLQSMECIERLVGLGMKVDAQDKRGQTPLHEAVKHSRKDAMEALLICKANPNTKDSNGKNAADLATNSSIAADMRMYTDLLAAMESGIIKAEGIKFDPTRSKEFTLKRVGIDVSVVKCTELLPFQVYCRREKTENSQIKIKTNKADDVDSDIFQIRVTDCVEVMTLELTIPLYSEIGKKEQPFFKFIDGRSQEFNDTFSKNGIVHCSIQVDLVPDTAETFVVYTKPRREDCVVDDGASTVQSKMDDEFKLDVPAGSFSQETKISLKVYDTDETPEPERKKLKNDKYAALLTDIYQINVEGNQPEKEVTVRFPCKSSDESDDIVILTANEDTMKDETSLEIVPSQPKVFNNNFVFAVSHFCIHVAVPKAVYLEKPKEVYEQIVAARNRKKPAAFFTMVLEQGMNQNIIVIEVAAAKSVDGRISYWKSKGYKTQDIVKSPDFFTDPAKEFGIEFGGNVSCSSFESTRRLAFMPRRASYQPFRVSVEDRDKPPIGEIIITEIDDATTEQDDTSDSLVVLPFVLPQPPKPIDPKKQVKFDIKENEDFKNNLNEDMKKKFIKYPWLEDNAELEKRMSNLLLKYEVKDPPKVMIRNIIQYSQGQFTHWRENVFLKLVRNDKEADTAAMPLADLCRHLLADILPGDISKDPACAKFTVLLRCNAVQIDAFMKSATGKPRASKHELPVTNKKFWGEFKQILEHPDMRNSETLKKYESVEVKRIDEYVKKYC